MDDPAFSELVAKARRGDESAARDLLAQFEEDVRLMVRVRLPRALRSQFDSMDFVQAVWQSFFAETDPSTFENPQHLRSYLAGVARNKVYEEYRKRTKTRKYDVRREESLTVVRGNREEPRPVPSPDSTPSETLQAQDRLDQLRQGRSPVEREVVTLRSQGLTFQEIADRLGIHERTVRKIIETIRQRMENRQWRKRDGR